MSAALYGSADGANRKFKKLYTNVGGVNREIKELWVMKDGVNRKIYQYVPPIPPLTWTWEDNSSPLFIVTKPTADYGYHADVGENTISGTGYGSLEFTLSTVITLPAGDSITFTAKSLYQHTTAEVSISLFDAHHHSVHPSSSPTLSFIPDEGEPPKTANITFSEPTEIRYVHVSVDNLDDYDAVAGDIRIRSNEFGSFYLTSNNSGINPIDT